MIQRRDELVQINWKELLKGHPERINANIPLEGQVALLPYDSRWEFPRNRERVKVKQHHILLIP